MTTDSGKLKLSKNRKRMRTLRRSTPVKLDCHGGEPGAGRTANVTDTGRPTARPQSQPKHVDCSERDGITKWPSELVAAGGDAAEVFEAADCCLDPLFLLVRLFVMADVDELVLLGRNHRLDTIVA